MMKVLDLFSGIGGFSLGLERAGMQTVAFCEIEEYPRKVLKKHWPDVPIYEDVRDVTAERLAADGINGIRVITAGFPCQDLSVAGKQAGIGEGTRSGLWSEVQRIISEIRPSYAIMENVTALLSGPNKYPGRWFGRVLGDLAEIGYDAEWHCIPAAYVGAPHHRDRVWILTYPSSQRWPEMALYDFARNGRETEKRWSSINAGPLVGNGSWQDWEKQSGIRIVIDGIPAGIHRCKCAGNSVVPQIPEIIGRAIMAAEGF